MINTFLKKIKNENISVGTILTLNAPEIAEMISACGFDWVFIDMEHGTLSISQTQQLIHAIGPNCSPVIRIPDNSPTWIKKALDTGCQGIIVPQIKTVSDAKNAINAAKYPPVGSRSVGIARAHGYGMKFEEYVNNANNETALILQIEHIDAMQNIDEIVAMKGIDGIFIGPYDLSGSMNKLGQVTDDEVKLTISKIKTKCNKKSMPWGIFVMKTEAVKKEELDGCSFIAVSIDTVLFWTSAKNIITMTKGDK